jgi:transposase
VQNCGCAAGEHPFRMAELGNQPDFRTINNFRGRCMKGIIEQEVAEVLEYLIDTGYIKLEYYFADGTKIEANANKHKVVLAKR